MDYILINIIKILNILLHYQILLNHFTFINMNPMDFSSLNFQIILNND